mgnify:CR=1 FL=1
MDVLIESEMLVRLGAPALPQIDMTLTLESVLFGQALLGEAIQMEMTGEALLLPVIEQGTSIQVEITRIAA